MHERAGRPGGEVAVGRVTLSGPIRIEQRGRDVYDRLVAEVFVNGQSMAELLI